MNPTQTEKENRIETADKPAERFAHTNQEKKRSENRRRASQYMKDLNRRNAIGDMLYMVGFWVEYVFVCVGRRVGAVVRGIGDTVRVMETRPLSKDKHWRLVEIVEKAK